MTKKQRVLISLMLATGASMLILAALSGGGSETDITVDGVEEIEAIIPEREANILRQDRVGIDLREGYVAALSFELNDGRTIAVPSDQLDATGQQIGRYTFKPSEGKVIPFFPNSSNCVTATYWPVDDRDDVDTIRWCFEVL